MLKDFLIEYKFKLIFLVFFMLFIYFIFGQYLNLFIKEYEFLFSLLSFILIISILVVGGKSFDYLKEELNYRLFYIEIALISFGLLLKSCNQ
jgi:uncharacterized membrane protein YjjP (DUF1212 family)